MVREERQWLALVPWQTVLTVNQELCQKDKQPHEPNPGQYEKAERLWNDTAARSLPLVEALDVFRQVHHLAPFKFFNGNTMAAVAKVMIGEELAAIPSMQAQMVRSTVAHYVVGAIKAKELESVLQHFSQLKKT
jgi:hypothetical protein